jgi:hypothetical protein
MKDNCPVITIHLIDNLATDCLLKCGHTPKNIDNQYIKPVDYSPSKYSTVRKKWYKKKMYRKYGVAYTVEDILSKWGAGDL